MQAVRLSDTHLRIEQIADGVGLVHFNDYFGKGRSVDTEPQAFLVNLETPGALLKVHMHDVDQFQVATRGNGRIGAHDWQPVSVQYADAFTAYGPIVRGDLGLSFHTIRMAAGGGNWKMPEARSLMVNGRPGRNVTARVDPTQPLPPPGATTREYLVSPHDDGLAIAVLRLGPDARCDGLEPAGGQYLLVCAGALVQGDGELPTESLLLVRAGEPAPRLEAGPQGALLLVMQFPRPSARKGSDPSTMGNRAGSYVSVANHITPLNP
ncbi:MAG: hypothetical protein AB7G13_06855 [Lautropia sp.]